MKLGRFFDIDVKIHWTTLFLIMMATSSFFQYAQIVKPDEPDLLLLLVALSMAGGLLLSVLLHEFGHILVGRKYGIYFKEVILHIFGGAAVMDGYIPGPKAELLMALAGPCVSLCLSFFLFLVGVPFAILDLQLPLLVLSGTASLNFALFVFNLLPAFPLDGGRVFRAALWYKIGHNRATRIAALTGRTMGFAMAACGVLMIAGFTIPMFGTGAKGGVWIIILGLMISMAAYAELKRVKNESNS